MGDLRCGHAVLDCKRKLGDKIGSPWAQDLSADDDTGAFLAQDLTKPSVSPMPAPYQER